MFGKISHKIEALFGGQKLMVEQLNRIEVILNQHEEFTLKD